MTTTQQIINVGAAPNDGNGDPLRTAFQKTNENFSVLFGIAGVTGIANGTSNISIPVANSNIYMSVGNVANIMTILANGAITTGNHTVTSYVNAGNVTTSGTILANGTIQSLGGVTAVTVTASGNLVGGNLNVTNQMRASTLLLTGNIVNAELNVTGNVNADNINATGALVVAANTSITGNVSGAYFIGNGSQLTGVTAAPANIFNIVNVQGSPSIIADSPNDTLSFTFGNNLTLTGNATTDTINVSFSDSPTFTGTVTSAAFVGDFKGSLFADDSTIMIDAVDQIVYADQVSTTGNITAVGNVSGNYILGNGALLTGVITSVANINSGTSNVAVVTPNGNIAVAIGGTPNVAVFAAAGIYVSGVANVTGNVTSGNLSTGIVSASGNVSATGNLAGGNISTTGIIAASGNVTAPYFIGNIIGNITGNLTVAGPNTAVVFNDGGTANSTAGFTFNKSTNAVATSGNITSTGNVSGIFLLGNLIGNISGGTTITGNAVVLGNLTVTGTTTEINVANLVITDKDIICAANATATLADLNGAGLQVGNRAAGGNITFFYNSTSNVMVLSHGANIDNGLNVTGNANATGNVQAGNIITTGLLSVTGNATAGNLTTAGIITVNSGNAATAIVNGGSNATGNIGSSVNYFNRVFATSTSALYADVSEKYLADQAYEPGTVVSIGGDCEITCSAVDQDIRVIGVVSTSPALRMNDGLSGANAVDVALLGRVPVLVNGPVQRGDLMVSAGDGRARAEPSPQVGSVIGKALQNFDGVHGKIEVIVGRI